MKRCYKCSEWKEEKEFSSNKSSKDGIARACKLCACLIASDFYKRNKVEHIKRKEKASDLYLRKKQNLLLEYLLSHPCVDCGNKDLRVLEFDHLDPIEKKMNVSQLLRTSGWEIIENEIEKCEVVCANCHRIRTISRADSYKNRIKIDNGKVTVSPSTHKYTSLKEASPDTDNGTKDKKPKFKNGLTDGRTIKDNYPNQQTKINWPSREDLGRLIWERPRSVLAKELGVSDKAIAKHCNKLGIPQPPRGYWSKLNSGKTDSKSAVLNED